MSKTLRELDLATETVTGDLYHISGSDLLDKRITIDDISLAVRSTLKGALVADDNVTIESGGLLLARANEDVIQEIGRVKVWGAGDVAYVSHYDFATSVGAGWQQNASGDAYINGASGRTAGIRIANADIITVNSTAITLSKPTTISGTTGTLLSVGADLNITTILGRATIYGDSDRAVFSHVDFATSTGYGVRHTSGGTLHLNGSGASEGVKIRQADADIAKFTNTAITLEENTTINGYAYINQDSDTNSSGIKILNSVETGTLRLWNDADHNSRIDSGLNSTYGIILNGVGGGAVLVGTETSNGIDDFQVDGSGYFSDELTVAGNQIEVTGTSPRLVLAENTSTYEWTIYSDSDNLYFGASNAGDVRFSLSGDGRVVIPSGELLIGSYTDVGDYALQVTGNGYFSGAVTCTTINTGNGATEIYDMNQDLRTDDAVTFAEVHSTGAITTDTTMQWKYYYSASSIDGNTIFDELATWIPTIGAYMSVHGGINNISTNRGALISIYRYSTTTIYISYYNVLDDEYTRLAVSNGSTSSYEYINIMSNFSQQL